MNPPKKKNRLLYNLLILLPFIILLTSPFLYEFWKDFRRNQRKQARIEKNIQQFEQSFAAHQEALKACREGLFELSQRWQARQAVSSPEAMHPAHQAVWEQLQRSGQTGFCHRTDSSHTVRPFNQENTLVFLDKDFVLQHWASTLTPSAEEIFTRVQSGDWRMEALNGEYRLFEKATPIPDLIPQLAAAEYVGVYTPLYHKEAQVGGALFTPGSLFGALDIYDLHTRQAMDRCFILTHNSEKIYTFQEKGQSRKEALEKKIVSDLDKNTIEGMKKLLSNQPG